MRTTRTKVSIRTSHSVFSVECSALELRVINSSSENRRYMSDTIIFRYLFYVQGRRSWLGLPTLSESETTCTVSLQSAMTTNPLFVSNFQAQPLLFKDDPKLVLHLFVVLVAAPSLRLTNKTSGCFRDSLTSHFSFNISAYRLC